MKQIILTISIKALMLFTVVNTMGCFNCENHINDEIKPMVIKGKIVSLDTVVSRPLKIYFSSKGLTEAFAFRETCGDYSLYKLRGKIEIGDSLIKEEGTDIFKVKQKTGIILNLKYQCCIQ